MTKWSLILLLISEPMSYNYKFILYGVTSVAIPLRVNSCIGIQMFKSKIFDLLFPSRDCGEFQGVVQTK